MAVEINWDKTHDHILVITVSDRWTWAEMAETVKKRNEMMESVDAIVDVIVNMEASSGMPANTLTGARQVGKNRPDKEGMTLVVGTSGFLQAMFDLYMRMNNHQSEVFHLVRTMDKAYAVVAERKLQRASS